MKFTKGENWRKLNITKNKIIYYEFSEENLLIRIGSRRIKTVFFYNKLLKEWAFHFGGCIKSNTPKTEHVDYTIRFLLMEEDQSL